MNTIYLSRGQEISGPFSAERIDELRQSGALLQFHYQWDSKTKYWTPLHAAPPPIVEWASTPSSGKLQVYLADQSYGSQMTTELSHAELLSATPVGLCLKIASLGDSHLSYLPGTPIQVLIFQESTGSEVETQARISNCESDHTGAWTLDLTWLGTVPKLDALVA